jgi:hypothetical protein
MKYKIIYNKDYAYAISDEKLKDGDWCFLEENHYLNEGFGKYNTKRAVGYGLHGTDFFKKVVAHLPLNGAFPINELPLLPEFSQEDDVEKVAKKEYPSTNTHLDRLDEADGNAYYRSIFKKGYNKAKETSQKEIAVYKNAYLKLLEFVKSKFDI